MTVPMILLVEDDERLRVLTARVLDHNGFSVCQATSGREMWGWLERFHVDLILLDVMLPDDNGIDLCRQIRARSDVPIIFVSARTDEMDRVIGLEVGADDYILKPTSGPELLARVRAVLRRGELDRGADRRKEEKAYFSGWQVDPRRRLVLSPVGSCIELTGAEFDLLITFIGSPQRVLGRERLIELSRARLGETSDRSIDVLVGRLRRKLSTESQEAPIITIRGRGYMLSSEVTYG